MAVVNSTLFLLLAMSSQVLTLPTEPIIPVPALSYPPYHPAHNPPAEVASTRPAVTKRPIVDHAAHNPPGDVAHTEHPAHHTAAGLDIIKEVLTKLPIIDAAHHAPGDPATTELAPTPTTPAATPTSPEPSNQPSPTAATSSPSLPIPSLATDTAPPSAIDLAPDPMDKYMIGMPTFFCTYRFQLNGKRDHYYLRGCNWNITGEQLETAVNKVVYNTPEWGVSPKGGADKDGKYKPGKNTTQDTITFKYSDTYVKDETNPVKGVQEFAAEWYIPTTPVRMVRDLEVEFERMLVNRPMYTARRTVGIHCDKMKDDEDSPWHPPVQASYIGGFNATAEVLLE